MTARKPARRRGDAGFTLIEVLLATLLMTIILGALATVTAQWLPNWNRGMSHVQRMERLATGLERIVADLSVAQMVTINADARTPLFDGGELAVTFVRSAVGPNSQPGLEIVRFAEKADAEGLVLVRERTRFTTTTADARVQLGGPVVLLRAPFRISFSYAGPDQVWRTTWRGEPVLPRFIRVVVRDGASGQLLSVSTIATVHVNLPPDCGRVKNPSACLAEKLNAPQAQSQGATL